MTATVQFEATNLLLRSAAEADQAFLRRLYLETKSAETAAWGLDAQEQEVLLEMQYRARVLTYAAEYSDAVDAIVCQPVGTGPARPVGRHQTARREGVILGIDLAILPEYQGRGIGSEVLRGVQQQCAAEGLIFKLQVLQTNPARRLYERLGFRVVSQDPVYVQMDWNNEGVRGRDAE